MQQKRTQNIVAQSRLTLPAVIAYAIAVWLVSGQLIPAIPFTFHQLFYEGAWLQFIAFLVSIFLMVVMNNENALIRIFSRLISCSFIVLTCAANFLFDSIPGAVTTLCMITFYIMLFHTYQDKESAGWTFYAFLCIGLCSIVFVQILYFVPLMWFSMFFHLSSLSWRTFFGSVIGLLTPYWFLLPVVIWQHQYEWVTNHFAVLADFQLTAGYNRLETKHLLMYLFVGALAVTGIIHFWRNRAGDRIRIRQIYDIFSYVSVVIMFLMLVMPEHYDQLLRLLIINTSPLIAHFLTLTHSRVTNITFYVICVTVLLLTVVNLWIPL